MTNASTSVSATTADPTEGGSAGSSGPSACDVERGPGCPCMGDDCVGGGVCVDGVCSLPLPNCGDGVVESGEKCDLGTGNDDAGDCTTLCTSQLCGDGFLGGQEACDDGNKFDGDACTNACALAVCGDAILSDGEQCDDGNEDNTDDCVEGCQTATCVSQGFTSGTPGCNGSCNYDTSGCVP